MKNIAIIGAYGNVSKWIISSLLEQYAMKAIYFENLYFIGRNLAKLNALKAEFTHQFILKSMPFSSQENPYFNSGSIHVSDTYECLKEADVIIVSVGVPMNEKIKERTDLLYENGKLATEIGNILKDLSLTKRPLIINITNPLDASTHILCRASQLEKSRFIGVSGILDNCRFADAIYQVLHVPIHTIDLQTLIVLGEHGPSMLPLLSKAKLSDGRALQSIATSAQCDEIIQLTRSIGTEIMEAFGKIPPHIGTGMAVCHLIMAVFNRSKTLLPCCVWSEKYQIFIGQNTSCGEGNIQPTHETLTHAETLQFENSVREIITQTQKFDEYIENLNVQSPTYSSFFKK